MVQSHLSTRSSPSSEFLTLPLLTIVMEVTISSYPPLGQITQLKDKTFSFIALLEVENDHAKEDPWEVAVWHSIGLDWSEKLLSRISASDSPSTLQTIGSSSVFLYFGASFSVPSSLKFTLKFRNGRNQPWRWCHEISGVTDGLVLVNPETPVQGLDTSLSDIIHGLNPELRVRAAASQTPNTQLWTIDAAVDPADGDHSAYADIEIGNPWGGALR